MKNLYSFINCLELEKYFSEMKKKFLLSLVFISEKGMKWSQWHVEYVIKCKRAEVIEKPFFVQNVNNVCVSI